MSSRGRNVIDLKKAAKQRVHTREESPREKKPKAVRLRVRRRRQRVVTAIACLLAAAGVAGGLGAASHLQQFAVGDVSVEGVATISKDAIVAAVGQVLHTDSFEFFSRKNVLLYPKSEIESKLMADVPRIKKVSVARESMLASALVVSVEERSAFAKWCDEACFVMDERGFVFAPEGDAPKVSYVFSGGLVSDENPVGQVFLEGRLSAVLGLLDALAAAGYAPQKFAVDSEKDFTITFEGGQRIMATFEMASADVVRNLTTVLNSDALGGNWGTVEYIDLRFGNRVYYK